MNSLALTDHGQMYGMIKFYRAAREAGIKPIYGCEVYQAPRSLQQKQHKIDSKNYHLVLLAMNDTGYRNLLKIVTTANLEGFYYRPRIDRALLAEHADGLICLSACISGQVPSLLVAGEVDRAREAVGWFKDLFGRDRFFLELQNHKGVPELARVNQQLAELAGEFDLRCVATNDVHYVKREDASAQELLLAIQTNTTLSDPSRMRMGSDDYYLMSGDEMRAILPEYQEAIENTLFVAEQCNVDLTPHGYHLPRVQVPEPYSSETYLRERCERGVKWRYDEITPEIRDRLEHELSVIHEMGFDDYFLINADLVQWAKNEAKMLVGPGRGSGASSLVAYSLGITELEPLGLGLIFERFLNPGRVSMPDIDLDYPDDRRQEVIDYLTRTYGEDKTGQIATFGTLGARAAVRDVGRALGVPLEDVDYVAKLIPNGPKQTIGKGMEEVAELKEQYDTKPYVRELVDYAQAVEGISRHLSTHAAGVLITDVPLVEYTPLQRAPRGEGVISQFCMEDVDEIGLLKLDVLGLSTLTVLDRAFKWVRKTRGIEITQESIPMDDPDTYALLSSGEVTGIFQVESAGMRRTMREMQPTDFKDIVALLALSRPGPMQFIPNYISRKFGREDVTYLHPTLEPILAETHGIIVYQEQIISIATELAGYSAAEADLMRRAVGKKKKKDLDKQHGKFVQGAVDSGIPEQAAEAIFADIEFFANYGFNKSHSAAYAVITVQTAYLKAHYPVEFMAAMLSVDRGNMDKLSILVGECRRLGITVLQPSVSYSDVDFTLALADAPNQTSPELLDAQSLGIRFGLGAIKNVGDGPAQMIVSARGDETFNDVADLADRVDLRQVNKRVLECLIRAGALDDLGERNALLSCLDQMISISQESHRAREVGQTSLFDLSPDLLGDSTGAQLTVCTDVPAFGEKRRLADEKELLGVYVSSHPLDMLSQYVDDRLTAVGQIDASMEQEQVQVAGVLDGVRVIMTKKGDPMAFAKIEDLSGQMEVVLFPRTYELTKAHLGGDGVLLIAGKIDVRNDEPKLIADAIEPYQPQSARKRRVSQKTPDHIFVSIQLADDDTTQDVVDRAWEILTESAGTVPFSLRLADRQGRVELSFPELGIDYSPQLAEKLTDLLGPDHLAVRWAQSA